MDEGEINKLIEKLAYGNYGKDEDRIKLIKIGEPAVPYLIDALKNENTRRGATHVLREISARGGNCSAAVPTLIDTLKDEMWVVREMAAEALGNIGDKRAVTSLTDALKDEDKDVPWEAASALGKIAKKTAEKGDCTSALNIIKDATQTLMKFYYGKKDHDSIRKKRLYLIPLKGFEQHIRDKMDPDKKKFPTKKEPKRMVKGKIARKTFC